MVRGARERTCSPHAILNSPPMADRFGLRCGTANGADSFRACSCRAPPLFKAALARFEFPPPKAGGIALFKSSRLKTVQTKKSELFLVPGRGLEPPRPCGHTHLKRTCMPISPPGQRKTNSLRYYSTPRKT